MVLATCPALRRILPLFRGEARGFNVAILKDFLSERLLIVAEFSVHVGLWADNATQESLFATLKNAASKRKSFMALSCAEFATS
jgi:hypothetical protein